MKFWISKNSEVSVHEQIVTQIRLGVVSRDLLPGEKLPSTRELARRFGIHPNTVSAAFRELAANNILDFRKGSGVFVTETVPDDGRPNDIDFLLANFIESASTAGFSRSDIEEAMGRWRNRDGKRNLILVESDLALRSIIEAEIDVFIGSRVTSIRREDFLSGDYDKNATLAALYDEKDRMQPLLEAGQKAIFIDVNSVPHSLIGSARPDKTNLIAVVSGWTSFIAFARIYLLAAKIDPEALIIRSTDEENWSSGLEAAAIVICDSFTARHFGVDPRLRVFRLITDGSIDKLKHAVM